MKTEISLTANEEMLLTKVSENLGEAIPELLGEVIGKYLKYFDGAEKLTYAEVALRDGKETYTVMVLTEDDLVGLLANDFAESDDDDWDELEEKAKDWLKNIPSDGSVVGYPNSKNSGLRLATEKEKYQTAFSDNKELEVFMPLTDFIFSGGFSGMAERLKKLADGLEC